ncbi:MAG: hypothetical protein AAAB35_23665 [Phyllobacterium sp.]|uniref:hypothetical protein n=1 Tax=Phyllobacterium sp. TaxID=1871046 RepID=UPI0030F05B97
MSTFSEDDLRAGISVALDWSTYVTVHAYAPNTIQQAINAGAACIEHAHLMDDDTARLMADKDIWLSISRFYRSRIRCLSQVRAWIGFKGICRHSHRL